MAASLDGQKRDRSDFSTALSSAFTEWILIILLLIDSFFLFLVSKIFHTYKLQTPCLLCSRFGYILGHEKLGFFCDLVCDAHKLEISSLAFCHVHKKLANAREMCETCLLSFAKKMSTLENCKFFLSKLSLDLADGDRILKSNSDETVKVLLLNQDCDVSSPQSRPCSCCSQPLINKPYKCKLSEYKSIFKELAYPGSPLSSARLRARAHLQDRLRKAKRVISMPLADCKPEGHSLDHFSHFRYRELKIASEPESEVPLSDDDDQSSKPQGTEDVKEKSVEKSLMSSSSITNAPKQCVILDDMVLEKLVRPDPVISAASASVLKSEHDEVSSFDKSLLESDVELGHGLNEISWTHVEGKPCPPTSSPVVSKPDPAGISNVKGKKCAHVPCSLCKTTFVQNSSFLKSFFFCHFIMDISETSSTSHFERTDLINITSKADKIMIESEHNLASYAIGAQPPLTSEITLARESVRLHEDLKQYLSHVPSPRWLQYPWTNTLHGAQKDDERKLSHSSSFNGMPTINKKPDIEILYSESTDGSIVSEVEGEVSVERLKKQIKIDRKSLSTLYKELEEERNASAIAANEAMAMINKLQEEKAAMQLEVMQYLRMMEEQTEYEQEALRNLNDQLTEREREIQDLQVELESFRKPSRDESMAEKFSQPLFDSDISEYSTTSTPQVVRSRRRKQHHLSSVMFQDSEWSAGPIKENLLDFEDEREYIKESLRRLEKTVHLFSSADASRLDDEEDEFNDEIYADDTKQVNLELQPDLADDGGSKHSLCSQNIVVGNCETQENNQMKEMISSENPPSPRIKSLSLEAICISPTLEAECFIGEHESYGRLSTSCTNKIKSKRGKRNSGTALCDEVEHLKARLEALEADRDFLDRTINSLRCGKDGLQYVQEITTHLRELRKIGLTQRDGVFA